ncbi:MAG: CBS domain-containing protein [Proteobacteria bacterium]|nr:CBS domain-containing protein [Pseudomonadota bacterium]
MQAKDIMTANVFSVHPDTSVYEVAKLLLAKRISAAPVVDETNRVRGIISEGDLLRRHETGTEKSRSWWTNLIAATEVQADRYVRAHGLRASDVMTRKVVTIDEDAPVSEIVDILESQNIKRVPVMRDDRLVGIVSRSNLLQGLVATLEETREARVGQPEDTTIQKAIMAELTQNLSATAADVSVAVRNGVVHIWGMMDSEEERKAVQVMAENVAGVAAVENHAGLARRWVAGI